jgi:hypothetical protein
MTWSPAQTGWLWMVLNSSVIGKQWTEKMWMDVVISVFAMLSRLLSPEGRSSVSSWVILEKPTVAQILNNFENNLWNMKVHCRVRKSPVFVPILSHVLILPISFHPISLRSISILSSYVHWVFLIVSYLLAFPTRFPIRIPLPHACYMPCRSHPHWLHHSNYIWRIV